METPDINIKTLAQEIKRAFNEEKRIQTGKAYHPHPRHNRPEAWERAAQNCIDLKCDAFSYVHSCFIYGVSVPGGPFQNQVCSVAGVKWFQKYQQLHGTVVNKDGTEDVFRNEIFNLMQFAVKQSLACEKQAIEEQAAGIKVAGPATAKAYFMDDSWTTIDSVPAFVRVALMPHDADILKKFGRKANAEVACNPRLLKVLKEMGRWK